MSGRIPSMFPQSPSTPQSPNDSKIPIPSSPTPFRRHNSLRLKGEVEYRRSTSREKGRPPETEGNRKHQNSSLGNSTQRQSTSRPTSLQRGNSFMESGEKRAGDDEGSRMHGVQQTLSRPNSVKIANGRLPGSSKSPSSAGRIRSSSLSLSISRINSPKSPSKPLNSPNQPVPSNSAGHSSGISTRHLSTTHLDSWDTDSVISIGSSVASCDHASVARNGTTFSGRSMKYVFHCNQHAGATGEDYLTPTQRAYRQVKKLKCLLHQAHKELEQKDSDIVKLTREVVELRLYKAALNSPEDKSHSNSSDAVTVRENTSEQQTPNTDDVSDSPAHHDFSTSIADSGHFEDGTNSSIHSNDDRSPFKSVPVDMLDKEVTAHIGVLERSSEQSKLIMEYERRIQELVRTHEEETYHLKQKHNDKVEELLQRITEINARYWELVPELEAAKEKIKELEHQLEAASKKLEEQETKAKQTYLKMCNQGQEAAKIEHENAVMEIARQHPNRVSVPELLNELQVTKNELDNIKDVEYASSSNHPHPLLSAKEALSLWVLGARKAMYRQLMEAKNKNKIDPEITLQFLKSAVYYFLTDKENSQGHLKAIESILGFTQNEIDNIQKAMT